VVHCHRAIEVDMGPAAQGFSFDLDGNLTEDGTYQYAWDAENRLVLVEPASSPANGDKKLEFAYDYMGRRVQKKVYTHNGSQWNLTLERRFVWADWLMLLELDGNNAVAAKYTWGLDLAGQNGLVNDIESAGGIGGLLAVHDPEDDPTPDKNYVYFYDANGNVGQLVAWASGYGGATGYEWHADRLVARYEYDPYGGELVATGDYAADNPFRFSTKYFDAETALGYWGYRYYSPRLGRWLSRDPAEEEGGANVYAYLQNQPCASVDPLGLQEWRFKRRNRLSQRLCDPRFGWIVVSGGDLADRLEFGHWQSAGREGLNPVFYRERRHYKHVRGPSAGCGQALSGAISVTFSRSVTVTVSSSVQVGLWEGASITTGRSTSVTTGMSITVSVNVSGGPEKCYEWKSYGLLEWVDVYKHKAPPGTVAVNPAVDPNTGHPLLGRYVGGGYSGRIGALVCKRCCGDSGGE